MTLGLFAGLAVALAPSSLLVPALLIGIGMALLPATPLAALVALLTLAPLRTLIATESGLSLPLSIGQAMLLLYAGVWLYHRLAQRKAILTLEGNPVLLALVGTILVYAIGAWSSHSLGGWLNEWLKWVLMALLVWLLTLSVDATWRWLVFAVLISAVANAIVGLYIFFGGSGADHLVILGGYFRAFGTFGQPNPFGGFMGLALPLAIAGGVSQLRAIWRSWQRDRCVAGAGLLLLAGYGLAFLLLAAALAASWSRGAWLGFAVSAMVIVISMPRRVWQGISLSLGIVGLVVLMWLVGVLPASIVNRLTTAATDLVSVSDVRGIEFYPWNYAVVERVAHWQAAVAMATDHPVFGIGLGNYELAYDQYRLINWEDALGHAHNLYLNLLAEAGVIGLLAYLVFWLIVFRLTWTIRRHPDPAARMVSAGLLGSWTYIAVHSLFDHLYVNNLFLHIGVLLSLLAVLYRQTHRALKLD